MRVQKTTSTQNPAPPAGALPPLAPRPSSGGGLPLLSAPPTVLTDSAGLPGLGPRPAPLVPPPLAPLAPASGARGVPPRSDAASRGASPPRSPRRRRGVIGLVAVLGLAIAAGAGAVIADMVRDESAPVATNKPVSTSDTAPSGLLSLPAAISTVEPSVVQVQASGSQGSGVVVSPRDLIVTNEHVVSGQTTVSIITADNRQIQAEVVATDSDSDLAILRPVGPPGPGVQMADEPDGGLRQGDTVFAIGSPFGLRGTVTSGVVSSLGRTGDRGQPVIQTDAPINPGNSGGGLFDLRGRLVGIPTEIRSPVPGNVGIGFAVTTAPIKALLTTVS